MNTDDLWPDADTAWWQVLKIQAKLHQSCGEPDAWKRARPVRRAGQGDGPS